MRHRIAIATALLLSAAAPAFAQDATPPSPEPATPAARAPARAEADVDRHCLRETGTRIRPRANRAQDAGCPSIHAGRVYTQEDLRSTGEIDMADALRKLDTSIH
ncbi:hypothetical protein [Cognatilysobacter segetis]|uniref:hypothetical protein n=1 Tax=Cognatilysobacter segetis TaxID=2492394 RepID=UPI00106140E5|nr:hypothetical protein [Lysobacter segetis]